MYVHLIVLYLQISAANAITGSKSYEQLQNCELQLQNFACDNRSKIMVILASLAFIANIKIAFFRIFFSFLTFSFLTFSLSVHHASRPGKACNLLADLPVEVLS
jgi:hypothetical protein